MDLPPIIVSDEVKFIAEATGLTFSEVYDEMDRLTEEAMARALQPVIDQLVAEYGRK